LSFEDIKYANSLEKIPLKRTIKKATVKQILLYMACYTNNGEFWLAGARIVAETGLNKDTVYKTIKWIREIGLIKDSGKREGFNKQIVVYKFTKQINFSTEAAIEMAISNNSSDLSENKDSNLSENKDSNLSENSETKRNLKDNKRTSCAKAPPKSIPKLQEQPNQKAEEEEGFYLIKKHLKRCKDITLMRELSEKHSIHSINCHLLQLQNDIAKGQGVTIGAILNRLENGDEWSGKVPLAVTNGGSKPNQQTHISFLSVEDRMKEQDERISSLLDKKTINPTEKTEAAAILKSKRKLLFG